MNCLAEERFIELLDRGGLDATRADERAHLEDCDACRESWATVAAAAELLAGSRPKAARGRLVPVMIAAAMLFTIVGVIVWKAAPKQKAEKPRDPVVTLLNGTPEEVRAVREALLQQGRKAIPALVAARPRFKGSARLQALQDLIFDLKLAAVKHDPDGVAVFQKLATRINLQFENTAFTDCLSFIRDFSGLNIVLDPTVDAGSVDKVDLKDMSLRGALEILCALKDLDFDHRYGVLFLTTPIRLWSTDPAAGVPAKNQWEAQVLAGADLAIAGKLPMIRVTVDMQGAPLSAVTDYLGEICGFTFKPDDAVAGRPVDIKVSDLRLSNLIQLLTLPAGRDARIEGGAVRIVPRIP